MRVVLLVALFALFVSPALAQSAAPPPPGIDVPDWALPGSPTHRQVAPPADFHRPPVTTIGKIGQFDAQTGVGGPLVPGSASYDPATNTYTINASGYNVWYQRDELHYLWKKMSGDVSLAASVVWPNLSDFFDRKVVLMFRDSLDDDSRVITVAQHGGGMVHLAWRKEKGGQMDDIEYRCARVGPKGTIHAARIGVEKKGDAFQLYISWQGEPLHPEGVPVTFKTNGPVYVGIGFTSHMPATVLTAKVADVVLVNAAGKVR